MLLSRWRQVALFGLAIAMFAGCESAPAELPLAEQAASVRAGESDRIVVELARLSDDDLRQISGLTTLRELLLDNAESHFTARGIEQLTNLPKLEHLRIRGSGIDDTALKLIVGLEGLQVLNVPQGTFGDSALVELKRLPKLELFRFHSPHVSDAGMQTLAELPAIKQLHLINVPITDAGLRALAGIERLESLYIDGGHFSDAALSYFFRRRPHLHVHFDQAHHDLDPQRHHN